MDPTRACYGPKHVEVAHERMAVQTLLVTDELFRSSDIATRKKYVNLVDSVKDSGGTAHIFSSMHVSGERTAAAKECRRKILTPTTQGLRGFYMTTHAKFSNGNANLCAAAFTNLMPSQWRLSNLTFHKYKISDNVTCTLSNNRLPILL